MPPAKRTAKDRKALSKRFKKNGDETLNDVFDFEREKCRELALTDYDKKAQEKISQIRHGTQRAIDEIRQIYEVEMLKYPKEVLDMKLHEYLAMMEDDGLIDNIDKDIDSKINEKLKSVQTKPPAHPNRGSRKEFNTAKKVLHVNLPEATPLEKFRAPKPNEKVVYSVRGSLILLDKMVGDRYNSSKKPRAVRKK